MQKKGTDLFFQDPDEDNIVFSYNLRFPGQYYDVDTQTHYNYYRYYDPQTGRYITSDPIGLQGGLDTYAYVENNPINKIDPLGLISWTNDRSKFRLVNCPEDYLIACGDICKKRGGVKSCKVTKGRRFGYPNDEIYFVPGSMNCVCNLDDSDPQPVGECPVPKN